MFLSISDLSSKLGQLPESQKVVLCHGCFDIVHPGHLEHFSEAKSLGDILVVGITSDAYIKKGPGRPVFNQEQRGDFIDSLRMVNYVTVVDDPSALPLIRAIKPDIYCKGPDYANADGAGNFESEKAAVESYGGKIVLTNGHKDSSSRLANIMGTRPPHIEEYFSRIKTKFTAADILNSLDSVKGCKTTIFGEAIVDRYVFVTPAGKSAKDNIVSYHATGESQTYFGGAWIIKENIAQIVDDVVILPYPEQFVTKTRYVDPAFMQKIFSVATDVQVTPMGELQISPADLGIVADFGHGLITADKAKIITQHSNYAVLMVQSNSSNWGFNLLTKYRYANYVVCDEMELRLACSSMDGDLKTLIKQQYIRMGTRLFAVTLGHKGCIIYDGSGFEEAPALATDVKDRMGAGDAFLSWTAPLAKSGAPKEMLAFVGNVAAGIKVGKVGNIATTKAELTQWVRSTLA